jgi:hypothetical protein
MHFGFNNQFIKAVVTHFFVSAQKKEENAKKIKNIFGRKIKNNTSEKRMLKRSENG